MSRIGKNPIVIPQGVEINLGDNNVVTIKGSKGELTKSFSTDLTIKLEDNNLQVDRPSDTKEHVSTLIQFY